MCRFRSGSLFLDSRVCCSSWFFLFFSGHAVCFCFVRPQFSFQDIPPPPLGRKGAPTSNTEEENTNTDKGIVGWDFFFLPQRNLRLESQLE